MDNIDIKNIPIEVLLGNPYEFLQDYFIKPIDPIQSVLNPIDDIDIETEDVPKDEIVESKKEPEIYIKKSVNDTESMVSDIMNDDTYNKLMEISEYHGSLDDKILYDIPEKESFDIDIAERINPLATIIDIDPGLSKNEEFNYLDLIGLKAKEAMLIINVKHIGTLEGLVNRGVIKKIKIGRSVRYSTLDVHRVARGYKRSKIIAIYARVWEKRAKKRRKLMQEQIRDVLDYTTSKNIPVKRIYRAYGFSLDFSRDTRKGFHALIYDVIRNRVDVVIIESPDRLSGVAFELIVQMFKYFGTKIVFLNEMPVNTKYRNEMVSELSELQKMFNKAIRKNEIVKEDINLYNTEYSRLLNI